MSVIFFKNVEYSTVENRISGNWRLSVAVEPVEGRVLFYPSQRSVFNPDESRDRLRVDGKTFQNEHHNERVTLSKT